MTLNIFSSWQVFEATLKVLRRWQPYYAVFQQLELQDEDIHGAYEYDILATAERAKCHMNSIDDIKNWATLGLVTTSNTDTLLSSLQHTFHSRDQRGSTNCPAKIFDSCKHHCFGHNKRSYMAQVHLIIPLWSTSQVYRYPSHLWASSIHHAVSIMFFLSMIHICGLVLGSQLESTYPLDQRIPNYTCSWNGC